MSENRCAQRQSDGAGTSVSQNQEHLNEKSADMLLSELECMLDEMTEFSYDDELVSAYLAALEECAPLDTQLDTEHAWAEFRHRHAVLFLPEERSSNPHRESVRRFPR